MCIYAVADSIFDVTGRKGRVTYSIAGVTNPVAGVTYPIVENNGPGNGYNGQSNRYNERGNDYNGPGNRYNERGNERKKGKKVIARSAIECHCEGTDVTEAISIKCDEIASPTARNDKRPVIARSIATKQSQ